MDLSAYFAERRRINAALDAQYPKGCCHLVSVPNSVTTTTAGSVSVVANENAARCLTEKTHRLATDEEVTGWQEHQEANRRDGQAAEWLSKAVYVVPPTGTKR